MIHSPEEFRTGTPPRIMGSETEYNVSHLTDEADFQPFMGQTAFFRERSRDDGNSLWLENGGRLYLDAGGIVEYATPEVNNAHSLLAYERAGEQIVQSMANDMLRAIDETDATRNGVYKRSGYDLPGRDSQTAGHHENYSTIIPPYEGAIDKETHPFHHALRSYLATRAVWAGAGLVRSNGYALSQKMTSIDFNARNKSAREGSKPAYLMTAGTLNQLELRVGDGNMSDWAIVQKFAFTSLVLRMIEQGAFPKHLLIPRGSANEAMLKTSEFKMIRVGDKEMHPAAHQGEIARYALEFASQHADMPEEEVAAAYEIIEACHQLQDVDLTLHGIGHVADRIDWAAKLALMRARSIDRPTNRNPYAVSIDLHWESVAKGGLARQWYADVDAPSLTSASSIELAKIVAPTTRAMARTALLQSLPEHPIDIRWEQIESADKKLYKFTDPYDALTDSHGHGS